MLREQVSFMEVWTLLVQMKLGSKYDLLRYPRNLKCKQIYWSKYLHSVEKIQWKL